MEETSEPRGRSGRPRDPAVAEKALQATLELYAEKGWSGLTMDAVAAKARIGKAALYLRWPTKEELLLEALTVAAPTISPDPTLGPRELLLDVGRRMLAQYTGDYGPAAVRSAIEARQLPEVFAPLHELYINEIRTGVTALNRAMERGEITLNVSAGTVIEVLAGALLMRALFTAQLHEEGLEEDGEAFIEEVVGLLLDGRASEAVAAATRTTA